MKTARLRPCRKTSLRAGFFGPVALVLVAYFVLNASIHAQNRVESALPIQIENAWRAGEKALRAERYGAALSQLNRVVSALQRPEIAVPAQTLAAAFHDRADANYGLENWPNARDDYSRVLELTPNVASAYAGRSIARKATGDWSGLIEDAQKAASLNSEYEGLLEDAHSTLLWRRVLLGFAGLGGLVLILGGIPFVKSLVKLANAK